MARERAKAQAQHAPTPDVEIDEQETGEQTADEQASTTDPAPAPATEAVATLDAPTEQPEPAVPAHENPALGPTEVLASPVVGLMSVKGLALLERPLTELEKPDAAALLARQLHAERPDMTADNFLSGHTQTKAHGELGRAVEKVGALLVAAALHRVQKGRQIAYLDGHGSIHTTAVENSRPTEDGGERATFRIHRGTPLEQAVTADRAPDGVEEWPAGTWREVAV